MIKLTKKQKEKRAFDKLWDKIKSKPFKRHIKQTYDADGFTYNKLRNAVKKNRSKFGLKVKLPKKLK